MKARHALALCVAMQWVDVFGIELPLGLVEVCTPARAGSCGPNISKKSALGVIVEGSNAEISDNAKRLQSCADAAAKEVDVRLLAAQPAEGNPLFKKIFLQCVEKKAIPVTVYFVAVKLDDQCKTEEKNAR